MSTLLLLTIQALVFAQNTTSQVSNGCGSSKTAQGLSVYCQNQTISSLYTVTQNYTTHNTIYINTPEDLQHYIEMVQFIPPLFRTISCGLKIALLLYFWIVKCCCPRNETNCCGSTCFGSKIVEIMQGFRVPSFVAGVIMCLSSIGYFIILTTLEGFHIKELWCWKGVMCTPNLVYSFGLLYCLFGFTCGLVCLAHYFCAISSQAYRICNAICNFFFAFYFMILLFPQEENGAVFNRRMIGIILILLSAISDLFHSVWKRAYFGDRRRAVDCIMKLRDRKSCMFNSEVSTLYRRCAIVGQRHHQECRTVTNGISGYLCSTETLCFVGYLLQIAFKGENVVQTSFVQVDDWRAVYYWSILVAVICGLKMCICLFCCVKAYCSMSCCMHDYRCVEKSSTDYDLQSVVKQCYNPELLAYYYQKNKCNPENDVQFNVQHNA